jgi:hypothetical protein
LPVLIPIAKMSQKNKTSLVDRFLNGVEKVGETKVVPKPKKEETPTNKYNSLQKGRIPKTCFVNSIF